MNLLEWTKIECINCKKLDVKTNLWETWFLCQGYYPGQFICEDCLDNPEVQCMEDCKICN